MSKRADGGDIVADEEHRPAMLARDFAHFAQALFLKRDIADGEHFGRMRTSGTEATGGGGPAISADSDTGPTAGVLMKRGDP
jgi:hypothetical protein